MSQDWVQLLGNNHEIELKIGEPFSTSWQSRAHIDILSVAESQNSVLEDIRGKGAITRQQILHCTRSVAPLMAILDSLLGILHHFRNNLEAAKQLDRLEASCTHCEYRCCWQTSHTSVDICQASRPLRFPPPALCYSYWTGR